MSIKKKIANYLLYLIRAKRITANITYSEPSGRLKGKRIIVTGGGSGLGATMAEKFVKEGAIVLIAGRRVDVLKATAEKVGCKYLQLDVNDVAEFDEFIQNAKDMLGGIDVLVNNAGISMHEQTFSEITPDTFDKQFSTNLKGGYFLTQKVVSSWTSAKQSGNILFVSSETGDTVDYRPYGLTKAAINSLVQGLAFLLARDGIRVNAVAPGITCSEMTGRSENDNLFILNHSTERVYLPEEVAETACFLISDTAGCISGQIVTCNNANTINARWK